MRGLQFYGIGRGIFNRYGLKKAAGWLVLLLVMMGFMQTGLVYGQDFSGAPLTGAAPLEVQFTDESADNPTGWAWYFGDEDWTAKTWTEVNSSAPWSARRGHSSVVLPDGSIVLIGGYDGNEKNDVWVSTDKGENWSAQRPLFDYRAWASSVSLSDGSIIVMGGKSEFSRENDVRKSTDKGNSWSSLTNEAGWSDRSNHTAVVLSDGSIVLMGGTEGSSSKNDVWKSEDQGATWVKMTDDAEWTPRFDHTSVVLADDSILLIGGNGGTVTSNYEVWRSNDSGETWTLLTETAGWSGYRHKSVVLADGSILVLGALDTRKGEVWRSSDGGSTWTQINSNAEWSSRNQFSSNVLPDGSVVLMGGESNSLLNDVWRMETATSELQNPKHTYTEAGTYDVSLQSYNADGFGNIQKSEYIEVNEPPLFCGGEGTEIDPYLICTADQLNNIREDLTAHYKLANDINMDVAPYNEGEGWEPIGSGSSPFSGSFDGDDFELRNLFINSPSVSYIGLFGNAQNATFENLAIVNVNITGGNSVGGLVGRNFNSLVNNSFSTGTINSENTRIGGLVGENIQQFSAGPQSRIMNSYSSVVVSGNGDVGGLTGYNSIGSIESSYSIGNVISTGEQAGGLVGHNYAGLINNSFASGSVEGTQDRVGGLVGSNSDLGSIYNSYATGDVKSSGHNVGGLVGYNLGSAVRYSYATGEVLGDHYVGGLVGEHNGGEIINSYATGYVSGSTDVGGLVGFNYGGGIVTDSYWDIETTNQTQSGGGEGKTTSEMKNIATFSAWDIVNTDTELNNGYPFLSWQDERDDFIWLITKPPLFCGGDGTEADPYLICDADQLNNIREDLTAHYKLANDIDLDVAPYNVGEGWEPIANYEHFNDDSNVPFAGKFDGNGKTISGLFINRPEEYGVGLFCWAEDFEISNLTLMDVNVTGLSRVGALVGDTTPSTPGTDGKIENVFVSGNIKGLQGAVGGLAGRTRNMSLSNAQTEVNVEGALDTGGSDIGGLVGNAQTDTFISHSSSSGTVFSMNNRVGGLTGMLWSSTIENSYSTVQVEGKREVGGLSGEMGRSKITGSYATGNVTAYTDGFEYGGLVGKVRSESTIKESYATGDVNGKLRLAGLVGDLRDDSMIEDCYAAGIINGEEETGGLVARKSSGTITNSFYDAQTSGQSDTGKGTPKTTAEMKQQGTFTDAGWDFANLWAIESGVYISYPYFGNSDEAPEQDPPPGYVKVSGFDEAPRLFVTAGKTTTVTVQHILFGEDESVTITQIPGHGDFALFLDDTAVDNNDVIQKSDVESGKLVYKTEDGVQPTTFIYDYDRFTYENSEQQRTLPIDLAAQTMPYGFTEGWFLFSSPGDGQTVGELLGNIRTEGYPGSTSPGASFPTVYTLDQENYQWAAVTNSNQVLVQGAGILVYVFDKDTPAEELLFSAGPWAPLDGSFTYDDLLWYDPGQGPQGNSHFLIGNPHPVGINICDMLREGTNMATSIDIWVPMENDGNGGYVNFSCDVPVKAISSYTQPEAQNEEIRFNGVLPPFIGFWVRTTDDNPSLAITDSDYVSAVGKQNDVKAEPVTLVLSHNERNYSNTVNILFSDRGSEGLDRIDAIKLSSAGLAQRYLSFYAMDDEGRNYALRSLPALAGDEVTIPLGIETTEEGSYSLTWSLPEGDNSGASYYLRDLSDGTTTQLNDGQSYSFELEAAAVSKAIDSPLSVVLETQSTAKAGAPRFELIVTTRELADNGTELPSEIVLRQNYPNPFNPSTVIQYELPQASAVRLAVFDMAGRQVAELVNGQVAAGSHSITFEAGSLSSGVYMYRLQAGGTLLTRKLTIIK